MHACIQTYTFIQEHQALQARNVHTLQLELRVAGLMCPEGGGAHHAHRKGDCMLGEACRQRNGCPEGDGTHRAHRKRDCVLGACGEKKRLRARECVAKSAGFKSAAEMDARHFSNMARMRDGGVEAVFNVYPVRNMQDVDLALDQILTQKTKALEVPDECCASRPPTRQPHCKRAVTDPTSAAACNLDALLHADDIWG